MNWAQKLAAAEAEKKSLLDEGLSTLAAGNPLPDDYQAKVDAIDARIAEATKSIEQLDAIEKQAKAAQSAAASHARKTSASAPVVKKEAYEDDPQRGFKTPREFVMATINAATGRVDERLRPLRLIAAGSDEHGEYSDSRGNYLVPPAYSPNLLQVQAEGDPTASLTTRIPMSTPKIQIPARVDKDHSTSVSGGMRVYRRAETQTVTESRTQFEMVNLDAAELFGVSYATEELLTDSPISFAALIEAGFRQEFPAKLMSEKISGTGVGQYQGILNSGCLVTVAKESGQAADTINGTNLLKMRKRAWGYGNCVWLANHDTIDQLALASIGNTGDARYLFRMEQGLDMVPTLMGRPVIFTEYVPKLGDLGDILLCNWSQYLEGQLQTPQMAESMHVRFLEHERTFKFYARNAGASWWRSPLTPKNATTNTMSPFVALAERA